jgi:hypothetical protein
MLHRMHSYTVGMLVLLAGCGAGVAQVAGTTYTNPVGDTPIHVGDGKLRVKGPTRSPQPLPSGVGDPPALPFTRSTPLRFEDPVTLDGVNHKR